MKNILYSFLLLLTIGVNAQIGIGAAKPDPTAIIDFTSTKKGFLLPRMNSAQREAIGKPDKPATGLQVYDTDTNSLWFYNGTTWANTIAVEASTTTKGILQLAGDLSGTTDVPAIAANAITTNKIANGTITNDDLKKGTGGLYKGSGTLKGNTKVDLLTHTLTFTSNAPESFIVDDADATFSVDTFDDVVGIGIKRPNTKAILDLTSTNKGILPPRMTTAQRNTIAPTTADAGLAIYNTTTNRLEVYDGGAWNSIDPITITPGVISTLNCGAATVSAPLFNNVDATGITLTIPYTGGTRGIIDAQRITSTVVTGLTASLGRGIIATGSGTLGFALTGTPTSSGTASFSIAIGSKTCIVNLTINGRIETIDCNGGTHQGTLTNGTLASGVKSIIPYTGGVNGAYAAQNIFSTGVTGLTAALPAGNFIDGAGSLTYTITGTPVGRGIASFAIAIGGKNCILTRPVNSSPATLDCSTASHNGGTMTKGIAASGINTVVPYAGGDGGAYIEQRISSSGVTGLTATLAAGNLATGNGTLTYVIDGTPSGAGDAIFTITMGSKSCFFKRTVK